MSSRSLNTMPSEKKKFLDSHEFLRRSPKGLWTKGEIKGESIVISCHRRHRVEGGVIHELDPDGDIIRSGHARSFEWGDPWGVAGEVKLTDELATMCEPVRFGEFSAAIMRHVVTMISEGYGDCPEEVVGWFGEKGMTYMVGAVFLFTGDSGKFTGLIGQRAHVEMSESESGGEGMLAAIEVGQTKFRVDLVSDEDIVDFMIATSPV